MRGREREKEKKREGGSEKKQVHVYEYGQLIISWIVFDE